MAKRKKEKKTTARPSNFTWDDLKQEVERQEHQGIGDASERLISGGKVDSLEGRQRHFQALCDVPLQARLTPDYQRQQSSYVQDHVRIIHTELKLAANEGSDICWKRLAPYVDDTPWDSLLKRLKDSRYHKVEACCRLWAKRVDKIALFEKSVRAEALRSHTNPGKLDPKFLLEYSLRQWNASFRQSVWMSRLRISYFRHFAFIYFL
ncbi:MAG: hypothetical protein M1822_003449 [Bathelium mastoideum]|nr:MAG: hypothetical protein M1822_003449 [Bathelium mastoideum]